MTLKDIVLTQIKVIKSYYKRLNRGISKIGVNNGK